MTPSTLGAIVTGVALATVLLVRTAGTVDEMTTIGLGATPQASNIVLGTAPPLGTSSQRWHEQVSPREWLVFDDAEAARVAVESNVVLLGEWGGSLVTAEVEVDLQTLGLRDREDGSLGATARLPLRPGMSALVENALYVAGYDAGDAVTDPGIVVVTEGPNQVLSVSQLLGPGSEAVGVGTWRGVMTSSDGSFVLSQLCHLGGACQIAIIEDGKVRLLPGTFDRPAVATGDVLITVSDDHFRLTAFSVLSGEKLWSRVGGELEQYYVAGEETLIAAERQGGVRYTVVALEIASGEATEIASQEYGSWFMWPGLSTDGYVALGPTYAPAIALEGGATSYSVIDLTSGSHMDAPTLTVAE